MEIILSKQCESLTGSLGSGFGYSIQKRTDLDGKTRFWAVRNSKGFIPFNGHLRFILACADLAQSKLHITDISVTREELTEALREARCMPLFIFRVKTYPEDYPVVFNAEQVMNFKERYNL